MIRFETLRQPARTLSPERAALVRDEILRMSRGLSDTPAFRANWDARIDDLLETTDVLDLAWDGDELVGALGERHLTLAGRQAVYIDLLLVAKRLQAGGLGRRLGGRSVLRTNLLWRGQDVFHVSRTCNPHLAAATWSGLRTGDAYYPSFDPASPARRDLVDAARELVDRLWPDKRFREDSGVLEAAYGGLYVDVPPTRHSDVARFFDAHIDASRGDAIVNVIRYGPRTWLRLAWHFQVHRLRRLLGKKPHRAPHRRRSVDVA
jgi:hypothetical protein